MTSTLKLLHVSALIISLVAVVKCTLERRGIGRFPLADLVRHRFAKPARIARHTGLGFLAGTLGVLLPVSALARMGWVHLEFVRDDSLTFFRMAFLTLIIKIFWAAIEELIVRGAVFPQMARVTHPAIALILSSVVFALSHLGREGVGSPNAITLTVLWLDGISFGLAYLATRSLWLPTLWHATKNIWVWLLLSESTMQWTHGMLRIQYLKPAAWVGSPHQAGGLDLAVAALAAAAVAFFGKNPLRQNRAWIKAQ